MCYDSVVGALFGPKDLTEIMAMSQNNKEQRGEFMRALSFLSQVGISIIICMLTGILLGRFLDGFFGTSPWLLLAFSLLGLMAAFKSIFDMARK